MRGSKLFRRYSLTLSLPTRWQNLIHLGSEVGLALMVVRKSELSSEQPPRAGREPSLQVRKEATETISWYLKSKEQRGTQGGRVRCNATQHAIDAGSCVPEVPGALLAASVPRHSRVPHANDVAHERGLVPVHKPRRLVVLYLVADPHLLLETRRRTGKDERRGGWELPVRLVKVVGVVVTPRFVPLRAV